MRDDQRAGPTGRWVVSGPSCDSVDVPFPEAELPELEVGDRVYVLNAGAYTLSYASAFNGFQPPTVHAWDEDGSSSAVAGPAGRAGAAVLVA